MPRHATNTNSCHAPTINSCHDTQQNSACASQNARSRTPRAHQFSSARMERASVRRASRRGNERPI
eukprot:5852350-Lingulodinium_polyedra.AAC.1